MSDNFSRNRALVRHVLLPTVFLTVALLGGLRVAAESGALEFVAPPLVTLILATLLLVLAARGRMVEVGSWLSAAHHPLTNVSHALTLASFFFASAQAFNSVLPERGLLRWMLSFFFLWTLWTYLFAPFDARRLLRGLAALFGTAFVVKHMLLASLYEPGGGLLSRAAGVLLEGVTLGTLDAPAHAPATGYISFFALALYVGGLLLLPAAPGDEERELITARAEEAEAGARRSLPSGGRASSAKAALSSENQSAAETRGAQQVDAVVVTPEEVDAEAVDDDERTLVNADERTLIAKDK